MVDANPTAAQVHLEPPDRKAPLEPRTRDASSAEPHLWWFCFGSLVLTHPATQITRSTRFDRRLRISLSTTENIPAGRILALEFGAYVVCPKVDFAEWRRSEKVRFEIS